jgi:hypothetical protein
LWRFLMVIFLVIFMAFVCCYFMVIFYGDFLWWFCLWCSFNGDFFYGDILWWLFIVCVFFFYGDILWWFILVLCGNMVK